MRALFTGILVLVASHVMGQYTFTAKVSKAKVGKNEDFELVFSVNGKGRNFEPPALVGDFYILTGPNPSSETYMDNYGVRYITGYSYLLRPRRTGKLTIGPARIDVEGNTFRTDPLEMTVLEQAPVAEAGDEASQFVFARAEVSNANPYVGEPVTVSLKLYLRANINQPEFVAEPAFAGFLKEKIELKERPQRDEMVNGVTFRMVLIDQFILIPQQSGSMQTGQWEMLIPVYKPSNQRDIFGRQMQQLVRETVVAKMPTLKVKPLPLEGQPEGFAGAVGQFRVDAGLAPEELDINASASYKIKVTGKGNLRILTLPEVAFPPVLEVYDPKYAENIQVSAAGLSGSKQNEYLIIPRSGGTYKIPGWRFSWFNPAKGMYETFDMPEKTLVVNGQGTAGGSFPRPATGARQEVETLAEDIRYVWPEAVMGRAPTRYWGSSSFWFSWLGLAMIMVFGVLVVWWSGRAPKRAVRLARMKAGWKKRLHGLSGAPLAHEVLVVLTQIYVEIGKAEAGKASGPELERVLNAVASEDALLGPFQFLAKLLAFRKQSRARDAAQPLCG